MLETQLQPTYPLAMLSAANLFCERDDRVLFRNLDFSLAQGQIVQVRGSNGSGKTTLLRILGGLSDWILYPSDAVDESMI